MIKLENVVLASPEQMKFVIEGIRNPMNSWEKSDSSYGFYIRREIDEPCSWGKIDDPTDEDFADDCVEYMDGIFNLGENDHSLMQRLSNAGTEHRKYMRMMPVYVRITAPLYWWKEFDTYKIGTVANSCSTMHKIAEKEFTLEDFSTEHLKFDGNGHICLTINLLNYWRKQYLKSKSKDDWWQMIQLLPSSYNQTRNVMLNYEVLANIYRQRKNHKLDEWREVCKWIESLPYSELIIKSPLDILREEIIKEVTKKYKDAPLSPSPFQVYPTTEYATLHPDWLEKVRNMAKPGYLQQPQTDLDMNDQHIALSKDDIQDILDYNIKIKTGLEASEEECP